MKPDGNKFENGFYCKPNPPSLPKPKQSASKPDISTVSFASQVPKSRISIGNRCRARIEAVYAPEAEVAETLYELLGVAETGSSFSDIKKAYKRTARKYHPDVSPPDKVDENTRRFIMAQQAYETLSNPQTRALYDGYLAGGLGFSFCARKSQQHHQEMEEEEEWRTRWRSQLDELKRRSSIGKMSWGGRMRCSSSFLDFVSIL